MHKKNKSRDNTSFSTKLFMALAAIGVLALLFFLFGGQTFPTDITYKRIGNDGRSYVVTRENP